MRATQPRRFGEVFVARDTDPVALDRLDDEGGDIAAGEFALEGFEVVEGHRVAIGEERPEPLAKMLVAVERQRAIGQAVEGVLAVENARAPGRVAAEFERRLDRLGSRIAEEGPVQVGRLGEERLGEQTGQGRGVELYELRELGAQHFAEGLDHTRVVAAQSEHAKSGQEVEIALALFIEQIGPARFAVLHVESNGAEHPHHLRIQIAFVERKGVGLALRKKLLDVHRRVLNSARVPRGSSRVLPGTPARRRRRPPLRRPPCR